MTSRRKRQRVSHEGTDVITAIGDQDADQLGEHPELVQPVQNTKVQQRRSLFVRSLPVSATTESLTEYFSQNYPVRHATVVKNPATKQSKGYGFVTFADAEDAERAKAEFDGSLFEGRKIRVEVAEPRNRNVEGANVDGHKKSQPSAAATEARAEREKQRSEGQKPPKLIVRNLPWTIKEPEQLAMLFRSYGKVKHATLPKKKPGLLAGFGFVILRGRKNAEKALVGVNGKEIEGRTLAVDWAVEKDVWETAQKVEENDQSANDDMSQLSDGAKREASDSVKSEDEEVELDHVPPSDAELGDDLDENGSETSDDDEADGLVWNNTTQDNSTTLFVRNLPFSSTDELLKDHFASFGAVRYARVVLDSATERSRGTGFVCFYNTDDADACLRVAPKPQSASRNTGDSKKNGAAAPSVKHSLLEDLYADPSGRYTLEGRVLQISRAVDRKEATRLTMEGSSLREARDRDKRRLYLLSEGMIPSNSPLYNKLAPSEVKMRDDSAKQRQTLIKGNPCLHLSLTRLSIRNIPRSVTSKDLKALAREAVVGFAKDVKTGSRRQLSKEELARGGDEMKAAERARKAKGKGIVTQAKIVYEGREGGKVAEDSGAGRSRGYGFVEYVSHRWALMGLRCLNGHAVGLDTVNDVGKIVSKDGAQERKKRLIVEFAIENAQVVGRRQEREAKARERSKVVAFEKEKMQGVVKKGLSKDALMARTRKGMKRKRVTGTVPDQDGATTSTTSGNDQSMDQAKLTKRQQIIGRKRMMRKSRKNTAST
ncbi:RNA recognition motif-containing protein [Hypocenomyce scalaris]|nr:RNA recognition motif-containing protein [Hypocenomyce scalaris]